MGKPGQRRRLPFSTGLSIPGSEKCSMSRGRSSPHLPGDFEGLKVIHFGVDLRGVSAAVAENGLCGIKAVLSAYPGSGVVAQLVRVPGRDLFQPRLDPFSIHFAHSAVDSAAV